MAVNTLLGSVFFALCTHGRHATRTLAEVLYTGLLDQMQATITLAAFLGAMLVASCPIDSNAFATKTTVKLTRPTFQVEAVVAVTAPFHHIYVTCMAGVALVTETLIPVARAVR
jgi:hypothetical protein